MTNLPIASIEYGGYISIVKFIVFLVGFFLWLPIVCWVHKDSKDVRTKTTLWTAVVFGAGAAAAAIWILVPLFIIAVSLYIIAVGATSIAYVMHRNARVASFEKVLTVDHIKSFFVDEQKKVAKVSKGLSFITANNNEVPLPQHKSPDFFGYKLANEIFDDAIWRRASEIVFLPAAQNYNIIYRIDGVIFKQPHKTREEMEYFIRFVKHLSDLNVEERRKPQAGRFKITKGAETFNWNVNTAGSTAGEQLQVRRIEESNLMKLNEIGLTATQFEQLNQIRDRTGGCLFIISGLKKTGVSTTFYAMVTNHDPFLYNVNTLEKQPSAELANITQNIFSLSDTGTTTYARKLQSILRTGPDIVGVADCQDAETAELACTGTKDGTTVYVTIEAPSAIHALGKWMKLVGNKKLIADTLGGICCQRLVRKLCNECKQAYEPNIQMLRKFNIPVEKVKVFYRAGKVKYDKRGKEIICQHCQGTGFFGRTAVFETIMINDDLRDAIRQSKTLPEIATIFRRSKMLYMQEQAIRKVADGITSINEVIREFSGPKKTQRQKKQTKK